MIDIPIPVEAIGVWECRKASKKDEPRRIITIDKNTNISDKLGLIQRIQQECRSTYRGRCPKNCEIENVKKILKGALKP